MDERRRSPDTIQTTGKNRKRTDIGEDERYGRGALFRKLKQRLGAIEPDDSVPEGAEMTRILPSAAAQIQDDASRGH